MTECSVMEKRLVGEFSLRITALRPCICDCPGHNVPVSKSDTHGSLFFFIPAIRLNFRPFSLREQIVHPNGPTLAQYMPTGTCGPCSQLNQGGNFYETRTDIQRNQRNHTFVPVVRAVSVSVRRCPSYACANRWPGRPNSW